MPVYEDHVRQCADAAEEARSEAMVRLTTGLDLDSPISAAVAAVAFTQAVARLWRDVMIAIDHDGLEAADALARTCEGARRTLTDSPIPRHACPFEQGFALAYVEGARAFYRATAHLEEITTTAAARTATGGAS